LTSLAIASVSDTSKYIKNRCIENYTPVFLLKSGYICSSSGKATSGNITFTAAQSIDLTVGFEATPSFFASIGTSGGTSTTTQDYVGGIEYKNNVLEAMYHAEGRAYRNGTTWQYEYTLKDHLGNSRVTFADLDNNGTINPLAEILQENHYYPFGLNQEGKWLNNAALPDTKYQYNGKELNEDLGLNWNHQDARFYDFAINRWSSVDPVTEGQEDFNPYHFSYNNPIRFNDPDGREPDGCCGGIIDDAYAFTLGAFNAIGSNGLGGAGRQDPSTLGSMASSAAAGQAFGDRLSVIAGAFEMAAGVVAGGGGAVAALPTGGAALAVSAVGATAIVQGSVMTATALKQLGQDNGRVNQLLPTELNVGKYGELSDAGSKGDNVTAHHIPSAQHMEQHGVKKNDGIAINMEHPHPGTGGRHRETATYGTKADKNMTARQALAFGVRDAKRIYEKAGLYTSKTRDALQKVVSENKAKHPNIFK
jgi:RHS repeat-associated protein